MVHISLAAVLQRIVACESGGVASHFGDVRDLLTGVLEACSYEHTLLSTCARLVAGDLHCAMDSLTRASRRATSLETDSCQVCGRAAIGPHSVMGTRRQSDDEVVCFHCRHLVHYTCLLDCVTATSPTMTEPRRWRCPVCWRTPVTVDMLGPPARRSATTSPSHRPTLTTLGGTTLGVSTLDTVQMESVDRLRSVSRSPSRLTVLAELAQLEHTRLGSSLGHSRSLQTCSSLLHNEQFALRLAVPPPPPGD